MRAPQCSAQSSVRPALAFWSDPSRDPISELGNWLTLKSSPEGRGQESVQLAGGLHAGNPVFRSLPPVVVPHAALYVVQHPLVPGQHVWSVWGKHAEPQRPGHVRLGCMLSTDYDPGLVCPLDLQLV